MSESESEDEILDRIEAALRKIAGMSGAALANAALSAAAQPGENETLDRAALADKLDAIIAKLHEGLDKLRPEPGA
jgi:hypothetical protein